MKHIVLIPALNEEESIAFVIKGIQKINIIDEIVVCDNGSRDKTIDIASSLGASITQETKRGYGHTLVKGINYLLKKYPQKENIVITFMDGDGADDPAELSYHNKMLAENDLILGSRTRLSQLHRGEFTHAMVNKFFGLLIFLLYGKWYTDLGPFRTMRLATFLNLNIQDLTFGFTAEPLCIAVKQNLIIHEYKTNHRQRYGGQSKVSGTPIRKQIKIGLHIIATIIKNRF